MNWITVTGSNADIVFVVWSGPCYARSLLVD